MARKIDLHDRLAETISKLSGIPIKIDYLAPDNDVGLIPNPGSHCVSADFDGLEYWQYNYAITLQTDNTREASQKLFKIQECLSDIKSLTSNNGSFEFDKIEVNSAPAMTLENVEGTVMYELDIAVFIYVQN